jgi:CPA1 family monovalent cation:H+ antiporter
MESGMTVLQIAALLLSLAAIFSYLNHRYIRLPTTIGLMLIALLLSLALLGLDKLGLVFPAEWARYVLHEVNFNLTVLQGMLSFLLFAGALHVNLDDLAQQKWVIAILASIGVLVSTIMIGALTWWLLGMLGLQIDLIYCLLFGALISPTDPIAVMGILKTANAPKSLETKIAGESLFNDGVGVVIFLALLGIASSGEVSAEEVIELFMVEAIGGVLFGLLVGWIAYRMLAKVDNYQVEILITLALVMGGYALAGAIHVSGPIAIVVAGLLIGNHGRVLAMSAKTREHLDTFWELVDEVLNAVLFVLIGLEVLALTFHKAYMPAALLLIPAVLLARFVSVGVPVMLMRRYRRFSPHAVKILTWGGLRGGISVALALSLPSGPERQAILAITYIVVVFSILVQGMTIGRLVRKTTA